MWDGNVTLLHVCYLLPHPQKGAEYCDEHVCLSVHEPFSRTAQFFVYVAGVPSVLWRCWLGGRKGIQPVENRVVGCWWLSVWSEVQTCIWLRWCHCHSLSLAPVKSRLVLPFWYRLNLGCPGKEAVKWLLLLPVARSPCGGIAIRHILPVSGWVFARKGWE